MEDDGEEQLLNQLMANGFVLEVFMLQMTLEMARSQPEPQSWARAFVNKMAERIDANEIRADDRRYPVHELSRQSLDRLGTHLTMILSSR
jgi:hypothetical protein